MAKLRVKLTKDKTISLILLCVILCIVIVSIWIYYITPKPIYSVNYYGYILNFRVDLRETEKVPVYPDDEAPYRELMHTLVKNITFALKPATAEENPYYKLQVIEVVTKLSAAYSVYNADVVFNREPIIIESYEDLKGSTQNPVIAFVHPAHSNETVVRVRDHVIFIKGEYDQDTKKALRNFDLATAKFLITALDIKIGE